MKQLFIGLLLTAAMAAQAQPGNTPGNGKLQGNPLLSQSFWQNKPDANAVKAEVAKGYDPAEMNGSAFDPAVMAINGNAPNESILYLLQQKGNDVNKITHDGRTYIFWAAARGNTEVMQYLIAKGAKADIEDSHGYSPFNFAAAGGQQNLQVYDLLLQSGSKPKAELTNDGANALLLAVGTDPELKLTSYFESKGLDIKSKDAAGNTAADYAARAGNIDVIKKLIERGVKPTDNAMLMAAQGSRRGSNTLAVFQYLESLGLHPKATSKKGDNALHAIVRRPGQADVIQYFLNKGVSINAANEDGRTPFMNAAAGNRDTATLALLLPAVKDLNQRDKEGATALALAVRSNAPETVQYLIMHGAAPAAADGAVLVQNLFEAYSPSSIKNFEAKMKILQDAGVNMAAPSKDGNTVYHLAAARNDVALLKLVQPLGADVNARNNEGLTALHKAAMVSKDGSTMQYLLSIGAKKDVKTSFDETAYDLAKENELLSKQKIAIDFLK